MRRVPTSKQKRDPDGRKLCLVCEKPVGKGRSSYCSDECWYRNNPGLMRNRVWERDRGVCAVCGTETEPKQKHLNGIDDILRAILDSHNKGDKDVEAIFVMLKQARENACVNWPKTYGHKWEMDHITPVVEGGGLCGLENYRTLCIPCHKKVTAELHTRLAGKKAEEKKRLVCERKLTLGQGVLF